MTRNFYTYFVALILGCLVISSAPVNAQNNLKQTTPEEVALLFYKMGNSIPNFSKWIKDTPEYNHTPWARREDKIATEKQDLISRYQEIDPDSKLIRVKVFVDIKLHEVEDNNKKAHVLSLKFSDAEKVDYFPYPFLDQYIAVIPTNLKDFRHNIISEDQYIFLKSMLDKKTSSTFPAFIEMLGEKADMTQPYDLDGVYQWILRSKIAIFSIYDSRGRVLWDKMQSWYTSPVTEDLNELYSGQYKDEPDYIGGIAP